jgi:hypothetical protein
MIDFEVGTRVRARRIAGGELIVGVIIEDRHTMSNEYCVRGDDSTVGYYVSKSSAALIVPVVDRNRFKIGDRVRVTDKRRTWKNGCAFTKVLEGEITRVPGDNQGYYRFGGDTVNWWESSLELAASTPETPFESDPVKHPSHYTDVVPGIECIDVVKHFAFAEGNAIKYIWRAGVKDKATRKQDLQKAIKNLEFAIAKIEDEE